MRERCGVGVPVALQVLVPNGRRQKPFKSYRLAGITGDTEWQQLDL